MIPGGQLLVLRSTVLLYYSRRKFLPVRVQVVLRVGVVAEQRLLMGGGRWTAALGVQ